MYARYNPTFASSGELSSSVTMPHIGAGAEGGLAHSKKTVSFSTNNLETVYRRSVSGEENEKGQHGGFRGATGYTSSNAAMAARAPQPPPPPKPRVTENPGFNPRPSSMGPSVSLATATVARGEPEEEHFQLQPKATV